MTIKLNPEQIRAVAKESAEEIYDKLAQLPQVGWVHGDTFLPENVLCSYYAQSKFIELLAKCIEVKLLIKL